LAGNQAFSRKTGAGGPSGENRAGRTSFEGPGRFIRASPVVAKKGGGGGEILKGVRSKKTGSPPRGFGPISVGGDLLTGGRPFCSAGKNGPTNRYSNLAQAKTGLLFLGGRGGYSRGGRGGSRFPDGGTSLMKMVQKNACLLEDVARAMTPAFPWRGHYKSTQIGGATKQNPKGGGAFEQAGGCGAQGVQFPGIFESKHRFNGPKSRRGGGGFEGFGRAGEPPRRRGFGGGRRVTAGPKTWLRSFCQA